MLKTKIDKVPAARLQEVVQSLRDYPELRYAMVIISTEDRVTDLKRAAEKATGRSRAELIGTDLSDCFADPDKACSIYRQALRKGGVSDGPLVLRHRDEHDTGVLYNASTHNNEKGEVSCLFASVRDISERQQAETRIHMLNQELEQCVAERTAQLERLPSTTWRTSTTPPLMIYAYHCLRSMGFPGFFATRMQHNLTRKGCVY